MKLSEYQVSKVDSRSADKTAPELVMMNSDDPMSTRPQSEPELALAVPVLIQTVQR